VKTKTQNMNKSKIVSIVGLLLCLLGIVNADAAVTVDSTASGVGPDPLSISRVIAVGATLDVLLCAADDGVVVVTSVTRSTDTYTECVACAALATSINTSIWYKTNPLSGTANVVATVAGSTEGLGCWGISVFGSDTATPFSTQSGVADSTADATESNAVTATAGEIIIDIIGLDVDTTTTLAAGSDQTEIVSTENTGEGHGFGGSYQQGSVAGGVMSWTWTNAARSAHSIAVIKAAAAPNRRPIIIVQ